MHHYTQGINTHQAHKGIPEGHFEEEQGHKGFFGPVSHILKKKPSTRWTHIEGPLKPRMFDLVKMKQVPGTYRLFYNNTLTIYLRWLNVSPADQLIGERDADGDLIYFCHQGEGDVLSEYGLLPYRRGHYIVVPKGLTHTFVPKTKTCFLMIEDRASHFTEPDRGMVGRHAVYDINTIGKPDLTKMHERLRELHAKVVKVNIKHSDEITTFTYDDCFYSDIVGWKGDLFPFTLHTDDMMPLMSHRSHLPPSAHTTFVAKDFVVCTFLPRPLEKDADALKVPFYHQNIDYDEILFYHDGDFFSRDNLHAGMLSFHPAGFAHGPHPKAVKNVSSKTETTEYAVMVDSRLPLKRDPLLDEVELKEYWKSWSK